MKPNPLWIIWLLFALAVTFTPFRTLADVFRTHSPAPVAAALPAIPFLLALGAWLNAAVAAVPEIHLDDVTIATNADTLASRRKPVRIVVAVPDAGRVMCLIDVLRPSGRFDRLVDMGNPMKGINLFPFLRRHVEGRALRAVDPRLGVA